MKRLKVEGSSNIAEYGYDPDNQTLEIMFHGGKIYQYWPVKLVAYKAFTDAKSKGKHFVEHFRNNAYYNFRQVDQMSSDLS